MNDFIEVNNNNEQYVIVLKEIMPKDKAYIIIKACTAENYLDIINKATSICMDNRASMIFMTLPDNINCEKIIKTDRFTYTFDSKMEHMTYDIDENNKSVEFDEKLCIIPLSIINAVSFLKIYNSCFYDVPNSATYTDEDIHRIFEDNNCKAYLIKYNNEYIGICELDYSGDNPVIASIGIEKSYRKKHLGYKSLCLIANSVKTCGYNRLELLVSSKNSSAYELYRAFGFKNDYTKSIWYKCN